MELWHVCGNEREVFRCLNEEGCGYQLCCTVGGGGTNNPGQNSVILLRSRWVIGVFVTYEEDMQYFWEYYIT